MGDGLWGFSEVPQPTPARYPSEALRGLSDLGTAIQRRQSFAGQQALAQARLEEQQRYHRERSGLRSRDLALREAAVRRAEQQAITGKLAEEHGGPFGYGLPDEWHEEPGMAQPQGQPLPPPPRPLAAGMEPAALGGRPSAPSAPAAAVPVAALRMTAPPRRAMPEIPAQAPVPRPPPAPAAVAAARPAEAQPRREARIRELVKEAKATGRRLDANEIREQLKEEGLGL